MPVTHITKDLDARSLTITAQFAAPIEHVWQVYADPRQLERVWGPPMYPATVVEHDLTPGGRVHYLMTGPDGDQVFGLWDVLSVDAPNSVRFEDFFADADFTRNLDLAVTHCTFAFTSIDGGTRAVYTSTFDSAEALQQVLDMGMEEGATLATNQIDALLAAG